VTAGTTCARDASLTWRLAEASRPPGEAVTSRFCAAGPYRAPRLRPVRDATPLIFWRSWFDPPPRGGGRLEAVIAVALAGAGQSDFAIGILSALGSSPKLPISPDEHAAAATVE
jgi:hypothetical protein